MSLLRTSVLSLLLFAATFFSAEAQPVLQNDYSFSMEMPSVVAIESSPAHMYILSETEGLAVFRTHKDSLQWLYSSAGMQRRGGTLRADIRHAYLFGKSTRLTVLAPTSVMGAYSATRLSTRPLDVERIDNHLYVAFGAQGIGRLSLETPQAFDADIKPINSPKLNEQPILDLEATTSTLYGLSANEELFVFAIQGDTLSLSKTLSLPQNINHLYAIGDTLLGSDQDGTIFSIAMDGKLTEYGSIGEPVTNILPWKNWLIIKGSSSRLWTSYKQNEPSLWKKNGDAGNFIAHSKGQLWICEYDRISRIVETSQPTAEVKKVEDTSSPVKIEPVQDQVIPYPNPLLIPLNISSDVPVNRVQLSYQSDIKDAVIRGQSFYWQPQSGDVGGHQVKIIASTQSGKIATTSFTVTVRSFNSPPRFIPLRPISIPVGHAFNLPINAIDPDGMNRNLIRYLGVDLPKGASINEKTGELTWTPTPQQAGKKTFRVIATDQYGAASSIDVTIRVLQTKLDQK